jgi:hypothetical protein
LEPKALCIFKKNAQPSAVRRHNCAASSLLFLACSRKMAAQDFRLCEIKEILQKCKAELFDVL